jgi:hypothetical protein
MKNGTKALPNVFDDDDDVDDAAAVDDDVDDDFYLCPARCFSHRVNHFFAR